MFVNIFQFDWAYNIGEQAVDIRVTQFQEGTSSILILGQYTQIVYFYGQKPF